MAVLQFSDKAARTLEAIYASADVVAQRRATLDHLALAHGEAVVDIGCGPGFLCEEMAEAVGESGRVLGVDVSDDLLTFARERNTRQWLAYEQGDARQLALPDASFDAAVCVQTLEYIDDADRAIGEMFRVLKPGGRALVVNTDWDRVAWYCLTKLEWLGFDSMGGALCPSTPPANTGPAAARGGFNYFCRSRPCRS